MAFLADFVVLSSLLSLVGSQLTWELVTNATARTGEPYPSRRRDSGLGYDPARELLVLFGGRTTTHGADVLLGDTWIYHLPTKKWREVKMTSSSSPIVRYGFVCGMSGDYFYVSTGEGPNRIYLNDMWRFDLRTETWEELPAQQKPYYYSMQQWVQQLRSELRPAFRYGSAGGIYPNSSNFYISLGFSTLTHSDTLSYDTNSKGWYREFPEYNPYNPSYPHARYLHAGTLQAPDELLLYGGCLTGGESGGPCPSGDSWVFNGKTKKWRSIGGCASPRMQASLAMLPFSEGHRRAVLYGGIETSQQVLTVIESPPDQVAVFNPDTETWVLRKADGRIPDKRASVAMVTSKDGIFMFGGANTKDETVLYNDLYLLHGDAATADQAPQSAKCSPTFFSLVMLHGILMAAAWGFFLPWGVFIARYAKNKKTWFHLHRLFQIFGLLIAIGGLVAGIMSVKSGHFRFVHAIIGLVVMILGLQQPLNGLIRPVRPRRGEPKTVHRVLWELWHRFSGDLAVILGLVNVSLGLFLGLAHFIIWVIWFAYLGLMLLINLIAKINKRWWEKREGETFISNRYILNSKRHTLIMEDVKNGFDNHALESEG